MKLTPVLQALQFNAGNTAGLEALSESAWPPLLRAMDDQGLTLPLAIRHASSLSPAIQTRLKRNLADNAERHTRLVKTYGAITAALQQQGIEFVLLKGLSRWPYYCADLRYRPSYDLDLFIPKPMVEQAQTVLSALGYVPVRGREPDTDHLPRMILQNGWTWRDNYFDPEMPTAVELHFRFWDPATERFRAGDTEVFWRRRLTRDIAGMALPTLSTVDALSYAALHLVRHLLRGALQLHHVYEVAHFLHESAADETFWTEWRDTGQASCRLPEAIAFRLAREWFRCDLHPAANAVMEQLPQAVLRWFELFGNSPALIAGTPNKNELWLHCALLTSASECREIAWRKLMPVRRGSPSLNPHVPPGSLALPVRIKAGIRQTGFMATRLIHHSVTLTRMLYSGLLWWRVNRRPLVQRLRKPLSETSAQ